jgi:membrane associated rhomboid family serine protease
MGIYDRDYYRDGSGGFNPFDHRMHTCIALVCLYVGVFVVQIGTREHTRNGEFLPGPVTQALELKASKVTEGEVWRVATYAFAHNPLYVVPIIVNILFLLWIGRHVEDIYGWKEFLAYYLVAGLLAGVVFVGVSAMTNLDGALLGPSGSVTAVLFLFALHYPKRTVFNLIPIWFVVAFYVLNDTLGFVGGRLHPGAFAAHAAGAGFALLYHQYSLRVLNWLPSLPSRSTRKPPRAKPKLHIFRDDPSTDEPAPSPAPSSVPASTPATASAPAAAPASGTATQSAMDEHLEAKLDEVLEKVKKHGQESLTEEERAVLFRASEIYRKRRKTGGD